MARFMLVTLPSFVVLFMGGDSMPFLTMRSKVHHLSKKIRHEIPLSSTTVGSKMVDPSSTATKFIAGALPKNEKLVGTVANGYLGTRIFSDTIYVSGVFNGNSTGSHRARIPSTIPTTVALPTDLNAKASRSYALDTEKGAFYQNITTDDGSTFLQQKVYAHRIYEHLLIAEISGRTNLPYGVKVKLTNNMGSNSTDIDFRIGATKDYGEMVGLTKIVEQPGTAKVEVAVVWSPPTGTAELVFKPSEMSQSFIFITAIATTLDSVDPLKAATEEYLKALELWKDDENILWDKHAKAWDDIWKQGRIDIEGSLSLAQAIYGSLYYIISSIRPSWPYGLSPGGLPSDGYMGHTFWDQATWMYPPLLIIHQDLARSCLQYRYNRIDAAKERAKQHGYEGTMFPWESAFTGFEVCPEPDPYSKYEHHIVGDVGFAAQQYWMATHDTDWFETTGRYLIQGTAEFWASRVSYNESKEAYVIDRVQGPDEYHYDVNNSVYTNVIAKMNLEFATYMFQKFTLSPPAKWKDISDKMYIPYDKDKNYHPEFDSYNLNDTVKQADVILLGFPLMYPMPESVRKNDLQIYEPRTDPNGPAMTKSMFAVGWLELNDDQQGAKSFTEGYSNIQEPFKVWTEEPGGEGAVNFITGAGGFLQSVIFGYGGLRLQLDGLYLSPKLPTNTKKIAFHGVTYLGNKFAIILSNETVTIQVTEQFEKHEKLNLFVEKTKEYFSLNLRVLVTFTQGKAVIRGDNKDIY